MPRTVTFAGEAAKWRLEQIEDWLSDAERALRETIEGLERQAESCRVATETVAELRARMEDLEEIEELSGGPVAIVGPRRGKRVA